MWLDNQGVHCGCPAILLSVGLIIKLIMLVHVYMAIYNAYI